MKSGRDLLFLSIFACFGCGSTDSASPVRPRDGGGGSPATGGTGAAGTNEAGGGTAAGGVRAAGGTSGVPDSGTGVGGTPDSGLTDASGTDSGSPPGRTRWVLGYYAVWQAWQFPLASVEFDRMTHVALSFVLARAPSAPTASSPYATLDTDNAVANLGTTGLSDFSAAAHARGTKALMSLGGGGAGQGFAQAAASANRAQFVSDVLAACAKWNYDGVDLDWEDSIDYADFGSLVHDLRAAAPAGFVITVPIGAVNDNLGIDPGARDLWSATFGEVDQLNVMTYTGSGAYPGWVVWHMNPLFGGGPDHPFDVASTMDAWQAVGIPKNKLGIGIGFYGRAVGPPVTAPLQSYDTAQVYGSDDTLSYGSIRRNFLGKGGAVYHVDDTAKVPWLSWPAPFQPSWGNDFPGETPPTVQFLTYEDLSSIGEKAQWVKDNGYGGTIIWTINEGVEFPDGHDGYRNTILDAVWLAFL